MPGSIDPIAGTIFRTRENRLTRILSVTSSIVTSAAAANRQWAINVISAASGITIGMWPAWNTQVAGVTAQHIWMLLYDRPTDLSSLNYFNSSLPENLLPPETQVRIINVGGSDAGDRIGGATFVIEEMVGEFLR